MMSAFRGMGAGLHSFAVWQLRTRNIPALPPEPTQGSLIAAKAAVAKRASDLICMLGGGIRTNTGGWGFRAGLMGGKREKGLFLYTLNHQPARAKRGGPSSTQGQVAWSAEKLLLYLTIHPVRHTEAYPSTHAERVEGVAFGVMFSFPHPHHPTCKYPWLQW